MLSDCGVVHEIDARVATTISEMILSITYYRLRQTLIFESLFYPLRQHLDFTELENSLASHPAFPLLEKFQS